MDIPAPGDIYYSISRRPADHNMWWGGTICSGEKQQRRPHAEAQSRGGVLGENGKDNNGTDFNAEAAEDAEGTWGKTKGNGPGAEKAEDAESHYQESVNLVKPWKGVR